jgi:hypothetical protein
MNRLVTLCLFILALSGCVPSMQVTRYDPKTGDTSATTYAPFFATRTILVPEKVGLDLIVDLEKKLIPGLYQLQRSLGVLGPGDLNATGLFTAYVHNLTNEPLQLNITAMTHQRQPIPGTPVVISLRPDTYEKVVLGRIGIFSYATELKIEFVYSASGVTATRTLTARRLTPAEIKADSLRWKGTKKNIPEFFLD